MWSDVCVCLSVGLRSHRTVSFWRWKCRNRSWKYWRKNKNIGTFSFSLFSFMNIWPETILPQEKRSRNSVLPPRGSKILLNLNSTLQNAGIVNKLSMSPEASSSPEVKKCRPKPPRRRFSWVCWGSEGLGERRTFSVKIPSEMMCVWWVLMKCWYLALKSLL